MARHWAEPGAGHVTCSSSRMVRHSTWAGLVATTEAGLLGGVALAALAIPAKHLGLLRIDFGRMLGTAVAPPSAAAKPIGWSLHLANGVMLAAGYRAAFALSQTRPSLRAGAWLGAAHFVAAMLALAVLPDIHPRPRAAGLRRLAPAAYGPMTVPGMLAGHIVYGSIVGARLSRHEHQRTRAAPSAFVALRAGDSVVPK